MLFYKPQEWNDEVHRHFYIHSAQTPQLATTPIFFEQT